MILYFKPHRGDTIKAMRFQNLVSDELGLFVKFVDERALSTKVASLLQDEPYQELGDISYDSAESFLLFSLEDELLEELLALMREHKISLPLKAKTTVNNLNWTLYELINHVKEESEVMQALYKLHQLLEASKSFEKLDSYDESLWEAFKVVRNEVEAHLARVGKDEIELKATLDLTEKFNQCVLDLIGKDKRDV